MYNKWIIFHEIRMDGQKKKKEKGEGEGGGKEKNRQL